LYDGLTEDLAVWRGNALFEGTSEAGAAAGTGLAETWEQLGDRTDKATDSLYRGEAAAPDQTSAQTIRTVVAALQATRSAVDARAEARFNTRGVDPSDQYNAAQAAERERLASGTLTDARAQLSTALTALSAIG
jgi:3-mercaptopyruvate sulfurtransferase SseA